MLKIGAKESVKTKRSNMIIEGPKTIEDFKKARETVLELMANPYCDSSMLKSLYEKRDKIDLKINELEEELKQPISTGIPFCQCLHEIENNLPRTISCFITCEDQHRILRDRENKKK